MDSSPETRNRINIDKDCISSNVVNHIDQLIKQQKVPETVYSKCIRKHQKQDQIVPQQETSDTPIIIEIKDLDNFYKLPSSYMIKIGNESNIVLVLFGDKEIASFSVNFERSKIRYRLANNFD